MRRSLLRPIVALLAVPLLALSACGGDSEPEQQAQNAGGGALEKTRIVVGTVPVLGVAPLYIALEKGYFKEEGLDVEARIYASGALSLPALIKGEIDLVFSNYISMFKAQAEGAGKLRVIAEGSSSAANSFGVYVMPNSTIREAKDLAGKKIGVNARGNIATVLTNESLTSAGVDINTINYVDVPFPDMGAALSRGDIDAAFLAEPFITANSAELGINRVVDTGVGTVDGLPMDGYGGTEGWVKQHPNTAAAFQRAIQKAAATAANRSETEKVITGYAKVNPKLAPLMAPLQYPTSINPTRLQRVADLMEAQKLLSAKLDVTTFVGVPS
ncbi:MAG TPA: ABC transporter substrate-binding protein [Pseudonocardiaceae bacterium]